MTMHFINPAPDGELMAELRDAGVLAPDMIDRIEAAMGRPECGTLNDFLLAGADIIPAQPWLSWLIRRHGCHRFGRVAWHDEAGAWVRDGPSADGNLPFRRGAPDCALVAVLRPDCREATSRWVKVPRLHWAAGTLGEIRQLHLAWRAFAACPGSS